MSPSERHAAEGEHAFASVKTLLQLTVVALFVATFVAQPSRIPSASMQPTLKVGDFVLVDKAAYGKQAFTPSGLGLWARWTGVLLPRRGVERGDVVIFHYPLHPETPLVKRVVGIAGDRIRLHEGKVYINGQAASEPYATYAAAPPDAFRDDFPAQHHLSADVEPAWWAMLRRTVVNGELLVPVDECFVLGDNRNDSLDSRYWGFVPDASIEGRPLAVLLSAAATRAGEGLRERLTGVVSNDRVVR